jgi:hypothetical protein
MPTTSTLETTDAAALAGLTSLMAVSCDMADRACDVMETNGHAGTVLLEHADQLAEAVGYLAASAGFTIDEVVEPLWR